MGDKVLGRWFWRLIILLANFGVLALYLYGPLLQDWFVGRPGDLRLYTFFNIIDHQLFRDFERETGIKLTIKYFDSNAELRAQLEGRNGHEYDVITPSDYIVPVFARQGFLYRIDHSRLSNYKDLDDRVVGLDFDPENRYSVPYAWAQYGVGYNKEWFRGLESPSSWAALFDPDSLWHGELWDSKREGYKVCLLDNPLDIAHAASIYLFGDSKHLSEARIKRITGLLVSCRPRVAAYVEANLSYFLSSTCPAVMATSALMKRLVDAGEQFGFAVPREGTMVAIEHFCIPIGAANVEAAYKFIDFMISARAGVAIFNEYGYIPVNKKSIDQLMRDGGGGSEELALSREDFSKFQYIHYDVEWKDIERMWLDVKSR